jgi:hypothetical protein
LPIINGKSGAGGGSLPVGWTVDSPSPGDFNANGGGIYDLHILDVRSVGTDSAFFVHSDGANKIHFNLADVANNSNSYLGVIDFSNPDTSQNYFFLQMWPFASDFAKTLYLLQAADGTGWGNFSVFDGVGVPQQAFVADPTGGATIDTQARAAVALILDQLQAYGWQAKS